VSEERDVALSSGSFDDREIEILVERTPILKAGAQYQLRLRRFGAAIFDVGHQGRCRIER
jgi:hypothetical protein